MVILFSVFKICQYIYNNHMCCLLLYTTSFAVKANSFIRLHKQSISEAFTRSSSAILILPAVDEY